MIPLPSLLARFVDQQGKILPPWNSYLQQFTQQPPNIMLLTVGASPFAYTAKEPGNVIVKGGTVTGLFITRGSIVVDITGAVIVPVAVEDIVTVTYSVLPTMKFIPAYGQNTNG